MEEKVNYTQFIVVSVIAFSIYFSNQMVVNTVTKYANTMAVTTQMIGFLGGMWGMASLITRPFAGQVTDNESHKPLLFLCVFVLVISNLVLVFATNFYALLLSRGINGIAWGFGSTLCMTTACNSLPKHKIASGLGIYTLTQTLAQVLGPSIALEIIDRFSFKALYVVTTAIMVIAFFLCYIFKTNHKGQNVRKYSIKLKNMIAIPAILPASVLMCNTMQVSAVAAFLLLFSDAIGVKGISFFFFLQALSIIVTRPFISKFINEKNDFIFTLICEGMIVLGLVSLFFAKSSLYFIIAAVLFGCGKSGAQPALTGMCVSSVPSNLRGKASNTSYTMQDLGQIFGSNIAGFFVANFGFRVSWLSIAAILLTVVLLFIIFYMKPQIKIRNMKRNEV